MVVASTTNITAGMVVSGLGFTSNTQTVVSVTNGTTLVLSGLSDSTPSGNLQFTNSGIGLPYIQKIATGTILGNRSGSAASPQAILPGDIVADGDGMKNALFSAENTVTTDVNAKVMLNKYDGSNTSNNTYGVIGITSSGVASKIVKTGSDGSLSAALLNINSYKAISSAGSTISFYTPGQFTFMSSQDTSGSSTTTINGVLNAAGTVITTTIQTGASVATTGTLTGQWSLGALSSFNASAGTLQSNNLTSGSGTTAGTFTGLWTHANDSTFSGSIFVADGTATNPSIAFNSDGGKDTGFYWGGDGYINWTNNGVRRGQFRPDGTAEIGTVLTGNITTGDPTYVGSITGNWQLSNGSQMQSTWSDLAEYYEGDQEYEPGTVLVFGGDKEVTTTNTINDTRSAGVVTTAPAYVMNHEQTGNRVCIALAGRVPCQVVGRVKKGDMLTTSATPGYAIKATTPTLGAIIGKALEDKDYGEAGVIEVAVGRA
jgi:hypothetical protein